MPLPTKEELKQYILNAQKASGENEISRRDIARAFNIKDNARTELRSMLKEMNNEGMINMSSGKKMSAGGELPPVCVLDVIQLDDMGDLICVPTKWRQKKAPPKIIMKAENAVKTRPALGVGDRMLGKVFQQDDGSYDVKPIKHIGRDADRVLGVFFANEQISKRNPIAGRVVPVSRKAKHDVFIDAGNQAKAKDGNLVWAEIIPSKHSHRTKGRVREILGDVSDSAQYSLIALATHDIPVEFPQAVEVESNAIADHNWTKESHEDWTHMPFITIDPHDARDHDDAVYAELDPSTDNEGGYILYVAIADVSWFVRPNSELDIEAVKRGNSTYLPDMVVPMLPERLSTDLCSLHEGVDRPVMSARIVYNKAGNKISQSFHRAVIHSRASLAYEAAQSFFDREKYPEIYDQHKAQIKDLEDTVLAPLYGCYEVLREARNRRAPMELELPERKIILDDNGHVCDVKMRDRFDAHKLIEEMMIQANVAAAEVLEAAKAPVIYRVHDTPDEERLEGVQKTLDSMGYSLPKGQVLKPMNLNTILKKAAERNEIEIVSTLILRSQRQAIYDTHNLGHFGLNLNKYAHFTSPIRRYADVCVHRGLVDACKLGAGGWGDIDAKLLDDVSEQISILERRSMLAERESNDRFLAAFMEDREGAEFQARISGVTASGLFVALTETGADGFIPMRTILGDYFHHVETAHALVGEKKKGVYRLGQIVDVKLMEVTPLQGGLRFEMLSDPDFDAALPDDMRLRGGDAGRKRKMGGSKDNKANKQFKKRDANGKKIRTAKQKTGRKKGGKKFTKPF